jgi:hypothetical protein
VEGLGGYSEGIWIGVWIFVILFVVPLFYKLNKNRFNDQKQSELV